MLQLLDTATRRVQEVPTGAGGTVGLYVCGPTVYGPPHIGHGRMALVYDVLRRWLEYHGVEVEHVSNVTDVDDKIINRANEEGSSTEEVAARAEEQWWSGMAALGVKEPHRTPHATDYIEQMVGLIGELVAVGAAYPTPDGVYLSVASVQGYGLLAHQSLDELRAGARVEPDETKRAPADFALWKAAKPGEPSWRSPFGAGRPGWHTECVVMSLELLGPGFSLHGGGQDLIFPHHENERAQAVALGRESARLWVHSGLATAGGEKMSKSLGNIWAIADLAAAVDPRAYRLLVLQSRFYSPLEVDLDSLEAAARSVERIDAFARRLRDLDVAEAPGEVAAQAEAAFVAAMDDNLDTPTALAGAFEAIRRANAMVDDGNPAGALGLGRRVLELLGAVGLEPAGAERPPRAVVELAERRVAARLARDFALADALRAEIENLGWTVEDVVGGYTLRRRHVER